MFKRVDHIEIVPRDVKATLDFYLNILGFKLKNRQEIKKPPMREVIYLELGDTVIEIISADNPSAKSTEAWQVGYRCVALEVEDMTAAVSYLKDKGIDMTIEPVDLGDSFRGELRDPDGLKIELREWK